MAGEHGLSGRGARAQWLGCTGSVAGEHGLSGWGAQAQWLGCTASVLGVHRLSGWGAQAQWLGCIGLDAPWHVDLRGPGIEPTYPELAGDPLPLSQQGSSKR